MWPNCYAECCNLVIMLSVVLQNVFILCVIMQHVIMLNVLMQNVYAVCHYA